MKKILLVLAVVFAMAITGVNAQITSLSVVSVSPTPANALFNCGYIGLSGTAYARIIYGTTVLDSISNYAFLSAGDGAFQITLLNLEPGTRVHYMLKITFPFTFDGDTGSFVVPTCGYTMSLSPVADTICTGGSVQLIGTVSGAISPTYTWTPASGLSSSAISSPIATPSTTTTYTLKVNDGGCTESASVKIVVMSPPNVTATGTATICLGNSTTLHGNGSGVTIWSWSPTTGLNDATLQNPVANPTITTTYTLIGTNAGGCSGTSSTIKVTIAPALAVTLTASPISICDGASSTLTGGGASTYSWSNGLGTGSSKIVSPSIMTIYTVTGTSANGCTNTAFVALTVNESPVLVFTPSADTMCKGSTVTLNVSGATTYSWSPSGSLIPAIGQTVMATPAQTTVYTVTGTTGGCTSTGSVEVVIANDPVLSGESYYSGSGMLILNGIFSSPIEIRTNGGLPYQTNTQNNAQAVFYGIVLNVNDVVTIEPIGASGCFTLWTYTATGIEKFEGKDVNIFPNPIKINEVLNIELPNGKYEIGLFDAIGQKVQGLSTEKSFSLPTSGLKEGIYILKIKDSEGVTINRKIDISN